MPVFALWPKGQGSVRRQSPLRIAASNVRDGFDCPSPPRGRTRPSGCSVCPRSGTHSNTHISSEDGTHSNTPISLRGGDEEECSREYRAAPESPDADIWRWGRGLG